MTERDMIPLARPELGEAEARASCRVWRSGQLVQGQEVARFETRLAQRCARPWAVAVSSGTAALELALRALGIGAGDEVLCPALTWPSPAHAVRTVGAEPVLVDVDPVEWTVRPEDMATARTERTRAAILIDQFGVPGRAAQLERALPGLAVIVDAACSLGSASREGPCGQPGVISCMSFHPRKVITTGEGGACLVSDVHLRDRLRTLRNHGQSAPGQFAVASGNYRMAEAPAAVGCAQLDRLDEICARRREHALDMRSRLSELNFQGHPAGARPNHQTLGLCLAESAPPRDQVITELQKQGVQAGRLSYALHELPQFAQEAARARRDGRSLAHASRLANRGLALPLFPAMTPQQRDRVVAAVRAALELGP